MQQYKPPKTHHRHIRYESAARSCTGCKNESALAVSSTRGLWEVIIEANLRLWWRLMFWKQLTLLITP